MSTLSTALRASFTRRTVSRSTCVSSFVDSVTPQATPLAEVPPCRIVKAGTEFIAHLLKQLGEVRTAADTQDERQATHEAFTVTRELLINATIIAGLEGRAIPFGYVTTDPEGGVRVEWFRPGARVHLVVRATRDRGGYIYHSNGPNYGTESATAYSLAKWLKIISG